ncbi:MAG: hypothetical protein E7397_01840 [Ruminococcaceae bacterium]|nr:hypothetical protein [Oscillospiraceae bacterium]
MRKSKSVLAILLIVIGVVIFYGVRYASSPVEVMSARMMQYEETVSGEAYFVWNERVYQAPSAGTAYHSTDEGARVGKNRIISSVYQGEVSEQILQELANINKKIEKLHSRQQSMSLYVDEYTAENRLENLRREIIKTVRSGNVSEIAEYKEEIKSVISGEGNISVAEEIEALKRDKYLAEQKIGQTKTDIYSDCSGVYSKNVDGLESQLQVERLSEYTTADFYALPVVNKEPAKTVVSSGDAVCKVIDNHIWYAMMLVERDKLDHVRDRKTVQVRFERVPGVEVTAKILRIWEDDSDSNALVILQCEQYADGIFSLRQSGVELILEQYQGFSVPISAIRVNDDTKEKGVQVKRGASEIFKPCEIVYTNKENETLIIQPAKGAKRVLESYDQIILGERWEDAKEKEEPKPTEQAKEEGTS